MVEKQNLPISASAGARIPPVAPPVVTTVVPIPTAARANNSLAVNFVSPVNQNGSFENDRVIKSGYVQKRTQKTRTWRTIFLVLRPYTLSIYKSDKEDKLRHKIFLSDLTAVAFLKDPKQKRQNVFGLFSSSRNFHFQANNATDAHEWVDLLRREARIEEEEEEMFLSSPVVRHASAGFGHSAVSGGVGSHPFGVTRSVAGSGPSPTSSGPGLYGSLDAYAERGGDRMLSSSPEPQAMAPPPRRPSQQQQQQQRLGQRKVSQAESSTWSGNELVSSDCSDGDTRPRLPGTISSDSFSVSPPSMAIGVGAGSGSYGRPQRVSTGMASTLETDPDRVVWQGWLWFLRSKGGVRKWKDSWAVLRPRNLILYKDESEYAAQFIIPLSSILNVVERDPYSRTKTHCMQVITEEKSYRFSAHEEEPLLQCLGAFKSLLSKRREIELRATLAATATTGPAATPAVAMAHTASTTTPGPSPGPSRAVVPAMTTTMTITI